MCIRVRGIPIVKSFEPWNVYVCAQPSECSVYSRTTLLRSQVDVVFVVICVILREEPSVYINGQPFVLRKEDDPYHNLFSDEGVVTR